MMNSIGKIVSTEEMYYMLKKIYFIAILIMMLPGAAFARGFHTGKMPSYRSYGSTHHVRAYVTNRGTYHQPHLSGNPNSGVHCRSNICN